VGCYVEICYLLYDCMFIEVFIDGEYLCIVIFNVLFDDEVSY